MEKDTIIKTLLLYSIFVTLCSVSMFIHYMFYFIEHSIHQKKCIETNNISNIERKKNIVERLKLSGAKEKEIYAILAVASIETEKFDIDYPVCDRKSGLACNVSIYKINLDMLSDIGRDSTKMKDLGYATETVLSAIRNYGYKEFIAFHRGGRSGLEGIKYKNEIQQYSKAIDKIALCYRNNSESLYNDIRYTIQVPAI